MDPITHALTGAAVAWAVTRDRRALLIGATAALAPDLDVLIRSASDPLLAVEHHRGFTHAIVTAPAGGALVALLWRRPRAFVAATAAWLSHALLDAATTYGTQLFWPFSRTRVGLDIISILDPLFTMIVLAAVVAAWRDRRRVASAAMLAALVWLIIGGVQRTRALDAQQELARSRGELLERGEVFPTVGNTIVWRSIYESRGTLRMDRIHVPWFRPPRSAAVTSVPRVTAIEGTPRSSRDFARFAWFSSGWVARSPSDPTLLGDARYSLRRDAYDPVWGIRFTASGTEWVDRSRERRAAWP